MDGKLLYEGKAKQVFSTPSEEEILIYYKDDATAFNGKKKGTITGKGAINNRVSNRLFAQLEEMGVPTHFIREIDERRTIARHVEIIPVEVVIRNIAAGGICERLGFAEGEKLEPYVIEYCYKSDELGDPMINKSHIRAMHLASAEEMEQIEELLDKTNKALIQIFDEMGLTLVDFKLEFGRFGGKVILADEISPDTCRLWDKETNEKLDKDRFRRDLGNIEEAYEEIARRVLGA